MLTTDLNEVREFLERDPLIIYNSRDLASRITGNLLELEGFRTKPYRWSIIGRYGIRFLSSIVNRESNVITLGIHRISSPEYKLGNCKVLMLIDSFVWEIEREDVDVYVVNRDTLPNHRIQTTSLIETILRVLPNPEKYIEERNFAKAILAAHFDDRYYNPCSPLLQEILEMHGGDEELNISHLIKKLSDLSLALFRNPTISFHIHSDFEPPSEIYCENEQEALEALRERGVEEELVLLPTIDGKTLLDISISYQSRLAESANLLRVKDVTANLNLIKEHVCSLKASWNFAEKIVPILKRIEGSTVTSYHNKPLELWRISTGAVTLCCIDTFSDPMGGISLLNCLPLGAVLAVRNPLYNSKTAFAIFSKSNIHAGILALEAASFKYKDVPRGVGNGEFRKGYLVRKVPYVPFDIIFYPLFDMLETNRKGVISLNRYCRHWSWIMNRPFLGYWKASTGDFLFYLSTAGRKIPDYLSKDLKISNFKKYPYCLMGKFPTPNSFLEFLQRCKRIYSDLEIIH